jgi:hypothetical protein
MRKFAALAATLTAFAGLTATGSAQKPDKSATLSLAVSPTIVRYGVPSTVSGALSSKQVGIEVVLEYQPYPYDGKWIDTGTTKTGADGSYSFTVTPPTSTHYRVSTVEKPAVVSNEGALLVKWSVGLGVSDKTPKKGSRVRFSGIVKPAYPNGIVYLQRKTAAGWKNVKQTTMTTGTVEQSNYSMRLRVKRTGRYRTVVLGDKSRETGVSPARRLVVG